LECIDKKQKKSKVPYEEKGKTLQSETSQEQEEKKLTKIL